MRMWDWINSKGPSPNKKPCFPRFPAEEATADLFGVCLFVKSFISRMVETSGFGFYLC